VCGIAGELRLSGVPAEPTRVERMLDAMRHRGPDGHGVHVDGPVALGHGRLAIRDLGPAAHQPMVAPEGAGALVYNGEVYGDGALRAELEREGARFRGTGDAEVVLHAVARMGPAAAARRFDGMFAFAWWDARARSLWLVRDRFGIKPLVVARAGDRWLFASEFRGLRAAGDGIGTEPDGLWVASYLVAGRGNADRSPYAGVEVVPPGGLWRLDPRGGVERGTWFDLVEDVDVERIVAARREPPARWVERVSDATETAVREHLESDVPVATFLSGGVDSGLVTALARRERPGLPAYTADTCAPGSEIALATATARHVGVELRPVRVDRDAHLRSWPAALVAAERPTLHVSTPEHHALAKAARADGIVVVLTGEGADELFGGYGTYRHTWARWRAARHPWLRLVSGAARRGRGRLEETPFAYQVASSAGQHLRLAAALLPEDARPWALLRRLARVEPLEERAALAHGIDSLRRHLGSILAHHDRIGMHASLEPRVPYLGTRVSDVALHLPWRAKVRGRRDKWVLREVAGRHLPAEVAQGKKQGFPIPESHDAGASRLLRGGAAADLLAWSPATQDALLPRVEADVPLRRQLVSLELWLRLFFRGEDPEALGERLHAVATGA
jgi:asparagine synthase (glutamine-hydrolysing)